MQRRHFASAFTELQGPGSFWGEMICASRTRSDLSSAARAPSKSLKTKRKARESSLLDAEKGHRVGALDASLPRRGAQLPAQKQQSGVPVLRLSFFLSPSFASDSPHVPIARAGSARRKSANRNLDEWRSHLCRTKLLLGQASFTWRRGWVLQEAIPDVRMRVRLEGR